MHHCSCALALQPINDELSPRVDQMGFTVLVHIDLFYQNVSQT